MASEQTMQVLSFAPDGVGFPVYATCEAEGDVASLAGRAFKLRETQKKRPVISSYAGMASLEGWRKKAGDSGEAHDES